MSFEMRQRGAKRQGDKDIMSRQRGKETKRQRDKETKRQRDKETKRQGDKEAKRQRGKETKHRMIGLSTWKK